MTDVVPEGTARDRSDHDDLLDVDEQTRATGGDHDELAGAGDANRGGHIPGTEPGQADPRAVTDFM